MNFRSDDGAYGRFSIVSASGIVPQQQIKFAELLFSRIRSALHTEDDCSHPDFPMLSGTGLFEGLDSKRLCDEAS